MTEVPPATWPYARSPTVDDLKIRTCFICRDEDESVPGVHRTRAEHGFVHACRCTLVAHEKCLLHWMDSGDDVRRQCAQCKEPYLVIGRRTPLPLRLMDAGNHALSRIGSNLLLGAVGLGLVSTTYVFCSAYGCYAARFMLGRGMYNYFLRDPANWPSSAYLILPAIPGAFFSLAADIAFPAPTLSSFGLWFIASAPMRPFAAGTTNVTFGMAMRQLLWDWPPSPWVLTMAWPIVQNLYSKGLRALEEHLLDNAAVRRQTQARRAAAPAERNVLFADVQFDVQIEARPADAAQGGGGLLHMVNGLSIGRALLAMVLLPPLASYAGGVLRGAAAHSHHLRAFLGIARPAYATLAASRGPTWLYALAGGSRLLTWGDFEPVWWHSLLGLSLVVAARDAVSLAYKLLLQHEDESRVVVDLPFTDVDIPSLELVVV